MKRKKIVLRNDFHNTATTATVVVIPGSERKGYVKLSKGQVMRIRRELCGSKECHCSGFLGIRGYQPYIDWEELAEDGSCLVHLRGY